MGPYWRALSLGLAFSLWKYRTATATKMRRASPPRTPPTIAPVLFDGLGAPFEEVGEDAGAEDRMEVIVTGDGEGAEGVEDEVVVDGVVLLGAAELDVVEGSNELVGVINRSSVTAALPQARYE